MKILFLCFFLFIIAKSEPIKGIVDDLSRLGVTVANTKPIVEPTFKNEPMTKPMTEPIIKPSTEPKSEPITVSTSVKSKKYLGEISNGKEKTTEERLTMLESIVSTLMDKNKNLEEENQNLRRQVETGLEELKDTIKPWRVPSCCQEYFEDGQTKNGSYLIRPNLEENAFEVYCEFSDEFGTTVVQHDHQELRSTAVVGKFGGCNEPGCLGIGIDYKSEMSQITALINLSADCSQSIMTNCTNAPLSNYAWWSDRNDEKREYWHGNFSNGEKGCKCSLEEDGCSKNVYGDQYACNCDADNESKIDEGDLTNREHLPITKLNFGASAQKFSWIEYKVGNLKCSGKLPGAEYPSEKAQKRLERIETNAEKMNEQIQMLNNVTDRLDTGGSSYFTAAANSYFTTDNYPIPFPDIIDEYNSGLNHGTGKVTIQVSGVYHFSTSLAQYSSTGTAIYIKHNDNVVCHSVAVSSSYNTLHCAITFKAKKGDTVFVYLVTGQIYYSYYSSRLCTFTGFLISAE